MLGVCVLAGVLVAGVLFPAVGGLGLLSNQASSTVDSVSSQIGSGLVPQTTVMLDKNGGTIATLWGDQRRTEVTGDKISPAMKSAIVSIEDKRFYEHAGVDYRGTARAFVSNANGNDTQGASTLTQQYVKNYLLLVLAQTDAERRQATETTPARKLREIRIALAVDKQLGKDEILTRYLNLVPFGNGAYGIQAAAQTYFGVNAADLTLPQSAMLAGMVQSSSTLNPYTNPRGVTDRRNTVLDTMRDNAIITAAVADALKATPLGVLPDPGSPANGCLGAGDRGFFCDYALAYLDGLGMKKADIVKGGYVIRTTLDPAVQASVKVAVNSEIPADLDGIANVMTTVQPGQDKHRVVAMASSRTYGQTPNTAQTVTPQANSLVSDGAGSIFKLFTTAAAMEQGLGISSRLDVPARFVSSVFSGGVKTCPSDGKGGNKYCVGNAGPYPTSMTVTDALAQSPNTAFVELLETATVAKSVELAQAMGLRSYGAPKTGTDGTRSIAEQTVAENQGSFTLGPKPVNLTELSNVAATIASSGMWCPPSPIESVTDSTGATVSPPIKPQACQQAVPPGLANTLFNAMGKDDKPGGTSSAAARLTGWDPNRPLGGKTGTTEVQKSSAFLGVMSTLSSAVMTYTDNPYPVQEAPNKQGICTRGDVGVTLCPVGNIFGGTVPARTFFRAMNPVVDSYGPAAFPPTDPLYVNGSKNGNVPSVVGQGATEATSALQALNFQVRQSTVDSGLARGTVVRQSLTGATVPGATVTLYTSSGSVPAAPSPPAAPPVDPNAPPVDPNAPPGVAPPAQGNPVAPPA